MRLQDIKPPFPVYPKTIQGAHVYKTQRQLTNK